ncbi:MAG: hypothetical protein IJW82_01235 [Clostridia bacterium]|nr:hypothetical protein [Clostridia bacterium]
MILRYTYDTGYQEYSAENDETYYEEGCLEHEVDDSECEKVVLEMITDEVIKKHLKEIPLEYKALIKKLILSGMKKLVYDADIELDLECFREELEDYYYDDAFNKGE